MKLSNIIKVNFLREFPHCFVPHVFCLQFACCITVVIKSPPGTWRFCCPMNLAKRIASPGRLMQSRRRCKNIIIRNKKKHKVDSDQDSQTHLGVGLERRWCTRKSMVDRHFLQTFARPGLLTAHAYQVMETQKNKTWTSKVFRKQICGMFNFKVLVEDIGLSTFGV